MLPARQFAVAAIASLLIAWALSVSFPSRAEAKAPDPSGACAGDTGIAVLASPMAPWRGAPLRVIFAVEQPLEGELQLISPKGTVAAKSRERHGGPPYFWFAEVSSPAAGKWHAKLSSEDGSAECRAVTHEIVVQRQRPRHPRAGKGVWPMHAAWNRDTENLYSAWIEKLFDAPIGEAPSSRSKSSMTAWMT